MGETSEVRVLVVDDDAASLEATRTMLGLSGYEVRSANNGALGLEEVLTFRPDVVIFDFWMPVADGRELLQGIREVGRRLGLVAMSGTPEVEDWCGRVGVHQFLRKPFERMDLIEAVRRAFDEARTASGRLRPASTPPDSRALRAHRAVMLVGNRELVTPIRNGLREHEHPMQVACVERVEDAMRALTSFRLDAVAVCGAADDPLLPELVAEANLRGLPIILDRAASGVFGTQVHVAPVGHAADVLSLIHSVVGAPRAQ